MRSLSMSAPSRSMTWWGHEQGQQRANQMGSVFQVQFHQPRVAWVMPDLHSASVRDGEAMTSTKTCWVIEQGEYSDYRVVGVFTSKANAERVAATLAGEFDKPTVSEWPLDPMVDELNAGLSRYFVLMLRDGTVERCEKRELSWYEPADSHHIWERTKVPAYKGKGVPDCLFAYLWAADEAHAIKIANEIRTRMVACGEWRP